VTSARAIRNLALVGFMGTGKSSVGRLVAADLRFDFADTDELIEMRAGRFIRDIFAEAGEAAFRRFENEVVAELAARNGVVISCGGGLVVNPDNLISLRSHALVVCLWAAPETIWQRTKHQSHRPLLLDADRPGKIQALLAEREPFYRQADVLVSTELRSVKEVAHQVAHQFRAARQQAVAP
jgi:shikimate kinase